MYETQNRKTHYTEFGLSDFIIRKTSSLHQRKQFMQIVLQHATKQLLSKKFLQGLWGQSKIQHEQPALRLENTIDFCNSLTHRRF